MTIPNLSGSPRSAQSASRQSGAISSQLSALTPGVGCTVTLTGHQGQRWNISIMDFGYSISSSNDYTGLESFQCRRYGKIKEADAEEVPICGSRTRQRTVYYSIGNQLTLYLSRSDLKAPQFIITFQGSAKFNIEDCMHNMLT